MNPVAYRVEKDIEKHIATVRLARPESGNLLLTEDIAALGGEVKALGSLPGIKVVVIRAEGDAFCLGRKPGPASGPKSALEVRTGITQPILNLYADLRDTPVPVIAVVQGEARGFGCALVAQCDLAIASVGARFSLPEMNSNLPPTLAISAVMGRVPHKHLAQMVYTRRQVDAQTALAFGLVSEIAPAESLDTAAQALVDCLTDRSRPALCAIKEYMLVAPHVDTNAAARIGSSLLSTVFSSPPEV